jgi:hypothetical protein
MKYQSSFLIAFFILITIGLKAQVNVGSTAAPDASAGLQVSTANKGFMPPKASLTATNVFGLTGSSGTVGMVVYNTNSSFATAGNYPSYGVGLYMWDGTGWVWQAAIPTLVADASLVTVANNTTSATLTFTATPDLKTSAIAPSVSATAITANTAGTYKIDIDGYSTPASTTTATGNYGIEVFDNGSLLGIYNIMVPSGSGGNLTFNCGFKTAFALSDAFTIKIANNGTGISANITLSSVTVQLLHK